MITLKTGMPDACTLYVKKKWIVRSQSAGKGAVASVSIVMVFILALTSCGTPPESTSTGRVDLNLPDDLEATLWATSPMFYNPTNIDVDMRGRLWVAEAVNYRNYNNDSTRSLHHAKGDRIVILEDTDGDGKADASKVFVQDKDLISPVGIAVIGNRIVVSCSPHLIVYYDDNGDDVPDKKEILLTGFGGRDHDHSLHSVVEAADGNWYFSVGNAGPHVVKDRSGWTLRSGSLYTGGSPYNDKNQGNMKSDDGKVWVGGLALRTKPDGTGLKVLGHNFRNSYETAVDSYGNMWQNDNDDQVVACRTSWLPEGGNAGYFSNDGTRYWQADQRPWQDIFTAHWHQDDPGVMPAGDQSGAGAPTGIVRYEGEALGASYTGMVLSADAGRNVVFGYHPKQHLSGFDLGARSNFATSLGEDNPLYVWNDSAQNHDSKKWFRPSDVAVGTDGSLFVSDWYDPVVGGHQMADSTGYGRIYRIAPKNKKLDKPVFDTTRIEGLATMLRNPAVHVRALASALLMKRGVEAVAPVAKLLNDNNEFVRARAIWLLARLGGAGEDRVNTLLRNDDAMVRATAFRALRQVTGDVLPLVRQMLNDSSALVRREVATALCGIDYKETKPLLIKLAASFDGVDRWYLDALANACAGHEADFYQALVDKGITGGNPLTWNARTSALVWRLHPDMLVPDIKTRAAAPSLTDSDRSKAITALAYIPTTVSVHALLELSRSSIARVADEARYWLAFRQSNDWFDLIDWSTSGMDPVQEKKRADMTVKANKLLNVQLPFDERKGNAQDMARDETGAQMLFELVNASKVPREFYPFIEREIFRNPSMAVRIQAGHYFTKPGVSRTYSIPAIVELKGEVTRGEALFVKDCSACHRIGTQGSDVGPELTHIGGKYDKAAILDAVVNPSAGIVFGYEPYLVTTKEGQAYYGLLVADGAKTVVIKDLVGRRNTIGVNQIKTRKRQENSLMPEPSSFGFSEQDLADLVAYLGGMK